MQFRILLPLLAAALIFSNSGASLASEEKHGSKFPEQHDGHSQEEERPRKEEDGKKRKESASRESPGKSHRDRNPSGHGGMSEQEHSCDSERRKKDSKEEKVERCEDDDEQEHSGTPSPGNGTPPPNSAPQITSTPLTAATISQTYTYPVQAVDADGDPLVFTLVTAPQGMTISPSGIVQWLPLASQVGVTEISVSVEDGRGGVDTQTYALTAIQPNTPPAAQDLSLSGTEDTEISVTLQATDLDGDALSYSLLTQSANGTLSGTAPNYLYTPLSNYAGTDSFTYQVSDGKTVSNTATVTIVIVGVNDPPVAQSAVLATPEEQPLPIGLLATDPDGDPLSFQIDAPPTQGTLSGTPPTLTYVPSPNYTGTDQFSFIADDGQLSSTGVVTIAIEPVDDPPVTQAVSAATPEDQPLAIELLATDPDGDALTFQITALPIQGSLSGTPPALTYTPNPNYAGPDQFSFSASDGQFASSAVFAITVEPINDPPAAQNANVTTPEDLLLAIELLATDPDGDSLIFEITNPPTQGTLAGTPPALTYTPDANYSGSDQFSFIASDGQIASAGVVAITVTPVNDPPVSVPVTASTEAGQVVELLLAATDADSAMLSYTIVTQPANGTLTGQPPAIQYLPNTGFTGTDSFQWTASDGQASSSATLASIEVIPAAPSITITPPAELLVEASGTMTSVDIGLATAVDGNGNPLSVSADVQGPFPLGDTLVTWTATSGGTTATAEQWVTVKDTTPPIIDVLGTNPVSTYCEFVFYMDEGAASNDLVDGDVSEQIVYGTSGSVWDGQFTITYTSEDSSGNVAQATRTVNSPCDFNLYMDAPWFLSDNGEYFTIEATGALTPSSLIGNVIAYDALGKELPVLSSMYSGEWAAILFTPTPIPELLPLGDHGIARTAIDSNGLMGQYVQWVSIVDTTPPTLTLNGAQQVSLNINDVYTEAGAIASDSVDGDLTAAITISGAVNTSVAGTYSITYSASDASGNANAAIRTVTVSSTTVTPPRGTDPGPVVPPPGTLPTLDITPPVVTAPPPVSAEANGIMTTVQLGAAVAVDDTDGALNAVADSTGPFPLGVSTVVWSTTDAAGNVGTASQTITIVDTTAPVVTAPADITTYSSGPVPLSLGTANVTDIFSFTLTNDAPAVFPIGQTSVLWTATDANGNASSDVQLVTVRFNNPPVANAGASQMVEQGTQVVLDGTGSIDSDGTIVSYEWAEGSNLLSSSASFTKSDFSVGSHEITFAVIDDHGAWDTATISIDVLPSMNACVPPALFDDTSYEDVYPTNDIAWAGTSFDDVKEIERGFNHARLADSTTTTYLSMPSQSVWDALDVQEKALYLINSERVARGLHPYEGISPNVVRVAQTYADYLLMNNEVITHHRSSDGADSQARLNEDPIIQAKSDREILPESLYAWEGTASMPTASAAAVKAIYRWIYADKRPLSGGAWGHRDHLLQIGILENGGSVSGEGLIGIGVSSGPYSAFSGVQGSQGVIVVLNTFDPSLTWDHTTTATVSLDLPPTCSVAEPGAGGSTAGTLALYSEPPIDGATVADLEINVSGTFVAPPNSGINVNGKVAAIDGNRFYARVPLSNGINILTTTITTQDGETFSVSPIVTRAGVPPSVQVHASALEGVGTLTVEFSIVNASDAEVTLSSSDWATNTYVPARQSLTYSADFSPGVWPVSFSSRDLNGLSTLHEFTVVVHEPGKVDQQLRRLWRDLIAALSGGDHTKGLTYLSESAQAKYGPVFDVLGPELAQVFASIPLLQTSELWTDLGEYAVKRSLNGQNHLFLIYFLRDGAGVWHLESM